MADVVVGKGVNCAKEKGDIHASSCGICRIFHWLQMLEKLQNYIKTNFLLNPGKERMCDLENHIGSVIKSVSHEVSIEE